MSATAPRGTRLALTGGLFSGKSTLARSLEDLGYVYVNYTQYLKRLAAEALTAIGIPTTVAAIEADKEYYRSFLIAFGSVVGFDKGAFVEEAIQASIDPTRFGVFHRDDLLPTQIVFDNVRFAPQMEKLLPLGFRLVRLTTPLDVRLVRAQAKGLTADEFVRRINDASEGPIPPYPGELQVVVDGEMAAVVDGLYRQLRERRQEEAHATNASAHS